MLPKKKKEKRVLNAVNFMCVHNKQTDFTPYIDKARCTHIG